MRGPGPRNHLGQRGRSIGGGEGGGPAATTANAAADELRRGVDDALAILLCRPENEWAHDFVLPPHADPAGDIAMLANPVAFAHAVTGAASGVTIPPSESAESGAAAAVAAGSTFTSTSTASTGDQLFASVDYVLIPAWCQHSVAVGIAVFRINDMLCCVTGIPEPARFARGRYIKDLRTSETLIVSRAVDHPTRLPSSSFITIYSERFPSATQRTHFCSFCNPDTFAQGRYADSAFISATGTLFRNCPICARPPQFCSGCRLRQVHPTSPLDFTILMPLVLMHSGDFRGRSHIYIRSFHRGSTFGVSFFGASWHRVYKDSPLGDGLRQFALRNTISQGNPGRAVMPAAPAEQASQPLTPHTGEVAAHATALGTRNWEEAWQEESSFDICLPRDAQLKATGLDVPEFNDAAANLFETLLRDLEPPNLADEATVSFATNLDASSGESRTRAREGAAAASSRPSADAEFLSVLGKDALRRAKNRASAARSNAKKQDYVESLERQVLEMRGRTEELRARQAALIEQNEKLLALLRLKGTTV